MFSLPSPITEGGVLPIKMQGHDCIMTHSAQSVGSGKGEKDRQLKIKWNFFWGGTQE